MKHRFFYNLFKSMKHLNELWDLPLKWHSKVCRYTIFPNERRKNLQFLFIVTIFEFTLSSPWIQLQAEIEWIISQSDTEL